MIEPGTMHSEDHTREDSIHVYLFEKLHQTAKDTVKYYQGDFYHDALWIYRNVKPGLKIFYFSFNVSGTWLSEDIGIGHYRKHRMTVRLDWGPSKHEDNRKVHVSIERLHPREQEGENNV